MTQFTIQLANGRVCEIAADEVTTRADGSLWLLAALAPKPHPLVPLVIFAARSWHSCTAEGAPVLFIVDQPSPANPEPPKPTPRFA
jgi:hypothetical protein